MMIDPCSITSKPLLSLEEAVARMRAEIRSIPDQQSVQLTQAYGRVLAEAVYSPINLPSDTNAAMDGYALNSSDIKVNKSFSLKLTGISWAGKPFPDALRLGQCVRIFTGAALPKGADTVVMQEQVNKDADNVVFPADVNPGANVRQIGEDVALGSLVCRQGQRLTIADVGLLAAAGVNTLKVYRQVNIAFFSTGDELVNLGQTLQPGQIYDSNRYLLRGLLTDPCLKVSDLGVAPDDLGRLQQVIQSAARLNDVIISTGGASVGDADYIQQILAKLGKVSIWKIAVKPGKPLVFGRIGDSLYFGLPGNPASMVVLFDQVIKPMLRLCCGAVEPEPLRLRAVCTSNLKKSPGRLEFQRGVLTTNTDGECFVASAGKQGSHILSSLSRSNCLIILPAECDGVKAGETVLVKPYGG